MLISVDSNVDNSNAETKRDMQARTKKTKNLKNILCT